ncbi:hypothetical protein R3P38DRAFT_2543198, partial [Favolaschia claudopus]
IVNAAQLGSPQNRYRVVVLAARHGLILTDLPLPTHAAQRPPNYTVSMTEESLPCAVRPSTSLSPHPGVTIQDAIGDMVGCTRPGTHLTYCLQLRNRKVPGARKQKEGAPQFDATLCRVGYEQPIEYPVAPFTSYQAGMRSNGCKTLSYHYTGGASLGVYVPAKHWAKISQKYKAPADRKKMWFARTDPNAKFHTVMTSMKPDSLGRRVLHPTQSRPFTLAEVKRAQGFYPFVNTRLSN